MHHGNDTTHKTLYTNNVASVFSQNVKNVFPEKNMFKSDRTPTWPDVTSCEKGLLLIILECKVSIENGKIWLCVDLLYLPCQNGADCATSALDVR